MNLHPSAAQRIVEQIAASVDLPVWVLDRTATVLAASTPVPLPQTAGPGPLDPSAPGLRALPLCYMDDQIGVLVLGDAPGCTAEVAQMAKALAEMVIHQSSVIELLANQQWALNKFVCDLLLTGFRGEPESVVYQEASLLGIDLAVPRLVVVFQVGQALTQLQCAQAAYLAGKESRFRQRRAVRRHLLRLAQEAFPAPGTVHGFMDEQQLVVLLTLDPGGDYRRPLRATGQRFLEKLMEAAHAPVSAGVGDYHPGWQALAHSYHDARFALEAGVALHGPGHVFTVADLGLAAFVCAGSLPATARLAGRLLDPLAACPELLHTLEVFLREELSPSQAAARLHIHRHTLTYRLGKIEELTGLNPRSFQAAVQFNAALLWQKLRHYPAPAVLGRLA